MTCPCTSELLACSVKNRQQECMMTSFLWHHHALLLTETLLIMAHSDARIPHTSRQCRCICQSKQGRRKTFRGGAAKSKRACAWPRREEKFICVSCRYTLKTLLRICVHGKYGDVIQARAHNNAVQREMNE